MKYPQLVSMPSAVSDWLEEQLEARGIDAVVYTRYVLSLLYRDPIDIICPDQELHANPQKEVRRAGGGGSRKRLCRPNNSYYHWGYADADQLKRSAAVECLKSASDQKCGIESLVDELCVKLKEIQNNSSDSDSPTPVRSVNEVARQAKCSDKDLAKRYYAAFPALSRNANPNPQVASPPNLIHLIPKWLGSPKRRISTKKNRSFDEKLHSTCKEAEWKSRSSGKRFNCFARQTAANMNGMNNNPGNGGGGSGGRRESGGCKRNLMNVYGHSPRNDFQRFGQRPDDGDDAPMKELPDDGMDMYEDLPVDIRDLLDSPPPPRMRVDLMNLANMRDTGSNKFLQCGTNIISSIWSADTMKDKLLPPSDHYDLNNKFIGSSLDRPAADHCLDMKFGNLIDRNLWADSPNRTATSDSLIDINWSYKLETKWSEGGEQESHVSRSLIKLNHNSEDSSFAIVKPRPCPYNAFFPPSNQLITKNSPPKDNGVKEDLLNSTKSHFKPISEKSEVPRPMREYADGTTFAISSQLDKVAFRRSQSGTMFLEEQGSPKRYSEYNKSISPVSEDEFVLKFNIKQNDKACQTDFDSEDEFRRMQEEIDFNFPEDFAKLREYTPTAASDNEAASDYGTYSDCDLLSFEKHEQPNDSMMADLFNKESKCEKCDTETWNMSLKPIGWEMIPCSQNIWTGDICKTCLRRSSDPSDDGFQGPPTDERKQLRDDITEDGEQLLSDLSSIQKCYMDDLPVAENSCDLALLLNFAAGSRGTAAEDVNEDDDDSAQSKEWNEFRLKRGGMPVHSASFSFATLLQQDCLLKMATIPTLRSVTL